MYPPDVLAIKGKYAAVEARDALITAIVGVFCFGFILGILAIRKANGALETMNIYEVAPEKRGLAKAAKVLGIVDIILWAFALIARFALK